MEPKSPPPDYRLALGYGSAWHLLRCLGWQRERFTAMVARAVEASSIRWLDFPAYAGNQPYPKNVPIRDGEWQRIAFIEDREVREAYSKFWPAGGGQQNWDAIGKAAINGAEEWLLVEAKAHPAEVSSRGTSASESRGRPKIRAAFQETLEALGSDACAAAAGAERWMAGYYQHANRLATLHFLTKQGISARLIFLYFCGDKHPDGKFCPTSQEEWEPFLELIYEDLGLTGSTPLEQRVHNIFMPVELAKDNLE